MPSPMDRHRDISDVSAAGSQEPGGQPGDQSGGFAKDCQQGVNNRVEVVESPQAWLDASCDLVEPIELVAGLPVGVVQQKLNIGVRMQDTGSRLVAFYLVEMEARRLYQATGHGSTVHYAQNRLSLEPRRSRELLSVGRKLLELPAMDEAFCRGEISWSQAVLLTRVAVPEHEQAWLDLARESTCRELSLEVKRSRPGSKPRDPEDRKGLAEIRFPIAADVSALAFQKWELAKKQLSEERGTAISDAECMEILAAMLLSTEEDGSLPGRKRARSSLFRLVVHQDGGAGVEAEEGQLRASLETEEGPVPLDRATLASIQCDAETIREVDAGPEAQDPGGKGSGGKGIELVRDGKTSAALRERVLTRDGHCCRSCASRYDLMVHHIRERSQGGPTRPDNLITVCMRCHGLVHADLLVLEGGHQARVRFVDREGRSLQSAGEPLPASALTRLTRDWDADAHHDSIGQKLSRSLARQLAKRAAQESGLIQDDARPEARSCPTDKAPAHRACASPTDLLTLEDLPAEVDVGWWKKHGHLFDQGKSGKFRFSPGFAVESPRTIYSCSDLRTAPTWIASPAQSPGPSPAPSSVPWPLRIGHPAPGRDEAVPLAKTADVRSAGSPAESRE